MAFCKAGDRRDQLGETGAQGDHCQPDDGIWHTERRSDLGAVIDQESCAEGNRGRADDQQDQLHRKGALFAAGLLFFLGLFGELRVLLHLHRGDDHVDHEHAEKHKTHPALKAPHRPSDHGIANYGGEKERTGQRKGLGVDLAGTDCNRERRDQACVTDDGADGIAVADTGVALQGRLAGDHHLGQRSADGDDGRTDQQLRQVKAARDADRAVNEPVAALDEQNKSGKK